MTARRLVALVIALAVMLVGAVTPVAHAVELGRISGRVLDPRGDPIPWIVVRVHEADLLDPDFSRTGTFTDAEGYYELDPLVVGAYRLSVHDWESEYPRSFWPDAATIDHGDLVEVGAGSDQTIDFRLSRERSTPVRAEGSVDTTSKAAVTNAYRQHFEANLVASAPAATPTELATCSPAGGLATQARSRDALNLLRRMAGVGALSPLLGEDEDMVRANALWSYANNTSLPSNIPKKCRNGLYHGSYADPHTERGPGALAALDTLTKDPDQVSGPGVADDWAYRRAVLDPTARSVAVASYGRFSTFRLLHEGEQHYQTPRVVTWPSAGWFPSQLLPRRPDASYPQAQVWSIHTASFEAWSLMRATVTMQRTDRPSAAIVVPSRSTNGSISFEAPSSIGATRGEIQSWKVTINNVGYRRQPTAITYTVNVFDPRIQIAAAGTPSVTGTAVVGSTLRAKAPTWSITGVTTGWQWLRDGRPIIGARSSTYLLGGSDAGKRITVRATGTKPNHHSATSLSRATSTVSKKKPVLTATARATKTMTGRTKTATMTISVRVTAPAEPALTGKVTLYRGTTAIKTASLRSGRAAFVLTGQKRPATHRFRVDYAGSTRVATARTTTSVTVR